MILRRLPRSLRLSALSLPLVLTVGCSSTPAGPLPGKDTSIRRRADGHCFKDFNPSCPPDVACNPPAPEPVACPDPKALDFDGWRDGVGRVEDGTCVVVKAPTCPPEGACTENLGGTTECVADKKTLKFDRFREVPPPAAGRIFRRADGTRLLMPPAPNCPPKATCNPPPPHPIPCPEDPTRIHTDLFKAP